MSGTGASATGQYWNHNTAFHDELVRDAAQRGGRVLDVGCGDGLLLERMAPMAERLVGIDTDAQALGRARRRLEGLETVRLEEQDLLAGDLAARLGAFQTVTCVAVLNHLPLRAGLRALRGLVAPGGRLIIVGLAASTTPWDLALEAASVLPVRLAGRLHHETADIGVPTAPARESLGQIRAAARETLPGCRIRRRFYYRYRLTWDRTWAATRRRRVPGPLLGGAGGGAGSGTAPGPAGRSGPRVR